MKRISLLTAKPPYKSKAKRSVEKLIKPAHYKDTETGKYEVKNIIDGNGNPETKNVPITARTFIDAIKETQEINVDVWIVETQDGELIETHEFADERSAQNYYKGFN